MPYTFEVNADIDDDNYFCIWMVKDGGGFLVAGDISNRQIAEFIVKSLEELQQEDIVELFQLKRSLDMDYLLGKTRQIQTTEYEFARLLKKHKAINNYQSQGQHNIWFDPMGEVVAICHYPAGVHLTVNYYLRKDLVK